MKFRITAPWPISHWPHQPQLVPAGTTINTDLPEWSWVTVAPPGAVALNRFTQDRMGSDAGPPDFSEEDEFWTEISEKHEREFQEALRRIEEGRRCG
jgi:hypothetical protein